LVLETNKTSHGLSRGQGASFPLIGKVLNHSQPSTTAIYARLDLEPVPEALEDNAARMLATMQGTKVGLVSLPLTDVV
jgi:hypothetical protein